MVFPVFAALGAKAVADDQVEIRPHRCVKLEAPGKTPKFWKRTLRQNKAIAVDLPFGPAHPGLDCEALLRKVRAEEDQAELANRTKEVIDFVEEEMLVQRGLLEKDGYVGRSGGPRVRWTNALPRKEGLAATYFGE